MVLRYSSGPWIWIVQNLPDDPAQLKKIIVSLFEDSQRKIDHLEEMVRLLKNEIFGRRSDKRPVADSRQFSLFELPEQDLPDETDEPQERQPVNGHTRRKPVRKPLPADLPRVDIIHDIDESEKVCGCGQQRVQVGQEVCEKLRYKPAELVVERHIRPKYACKGCEGVEDEGPTVKIAPPPAQLIPKSFATGFAGLAHCLCQVRRCPAAVSAGENLCPSGN